MADIYNMADTWNAAGTTFTAIKMNVTDTASAAASLLMDLQVGGASKFSVNKGGGIRSTVGYSATNVLIGPAGNTGFAWSGTSLFHIANGAANFSIYTNGIKVNGDKSIGFSTAGVDAGDPDLYLYRDAAGILAQRNGTNAQAFRLYNTYTDAANYERARIEWASNSLRIGTEAAGTGVAREVQFYAGVEMYFNTNGTFRWYFGGTSGHFLAYTDNTYDIGAASSLRPRNLFLGSYQQMTEMTAPAAPAANSVRIFAQDNGAGKTQLMAIFGSGAAQQIAIEP